MSQAPVIFLMAQTNNSELIREIQSATKLQTMQGLPTVVANQIIPTIEVNPKSIKDALIISASTAVSGAGTLLASNAYTNRDVRIHSISYGMIKDAANDSATGVSGITVTIGGASKQIIAIPHIVSTAQNTFVTLSFPHAILIDRNTAVSFSNTTYAAGLMSRTASISITVDDTSNA